MSEVLSNQGIDISTSNMVLGVPDGTFLVTIDLLGHVYLVTDYVAEYGYAVDRDEDCYIDNSDDFPEDPTEWRDLDYDGIGDNADEFPYDANNGNPVNIEDVFSDVHSEQFQPGTGEISLDVLEAAYQLVYLVDSGQTLSIEQLNLFYTIIKNDISNYTGNEFAPENFLGSDNYYKINIHESTSIALGNQKIYISIENILHGSSSRTSLVETGLYDHASDIITYGKTYGYKY